MAVTNDDIKAAKIELLGAQKAVSASQAQVGVKSDALNQLNYQKQIEDLGIQS